MTEGPCREALAFEGLYNSAMIQVKLLGLPLR